MSNVFCGEKKSYEDIMDEIMETYTDEDCCECCGNARAIDMGLCNDCYDYIYMFSNPPQYVKDYIEKHKDDLED